MSNVAIIPARGGSKRIPRKNIKNFIGKPIISYSIETALKSNLFDEIIVSTDDPEIAEISMKYGASVPFLRSSENSNDFAGTEIVLQEVLQNMKLLNRTFDYGCCIYPTSPLLDVDLLNRGLELLQKNKFDSVFSVTKFSYPILRALNVDSNSRVNMKWPENEEVRSQDMQDFYHDAGQFYWFNANHIVNNGNLFSINSGAVVLSEIEVQDIDNESDWKMAEIKYKLNNGQY